MVASGWLVAAAPFGAYTGDLPAIVGARWAPAEDEIDEINESASAGNVRRAGKHDISHLRSAEGNHGAFSRRGYHIPSASRRKSFGSSTSSGGAVVMSTYATRSGER